ncbi:hypothetical protein A8L48_01315 [Rhizobium rhizogenes]|nr:hypothetical protein A8L48_01315 [Rhizobium rhizogenes]
MTMVGPFRPLADDLLALAHTTQPTHSPHFCACHRNPADAVCAAEKLLQPKDLGWLDPCDKHRDEGGGVVD